MIFLILLLAVCNAVNLNSKYFKSDFIVPSDCTIQPTQQECIKYAQLTMQQEVVITHHAAAEGCLFDGKVRWNIPFLEVSSGSPATLVVEVTEGKPNLLGMLTQSECQAYGGSNWGGNGHTYISDQDSLSHSGSCTGWAGGNECDTNPSYMWGDCKKECSKRGSPPGCVQRGSEVWYNEYDSSRNCGYGNVNCIQKPMTELPCAPHQCICKRGNVVGTTYQAGTLSDRFFEYVEVSTGSPALDGSAAVSQKECKVYAESMGDTTYEVVSFANGGPEGCINRDNVGIRYNEATCLSECNCGHGGLWRCVQKRIFSENDFLNVSSGSPNLLVSEQECQYYATSINMPFSIVHTNLIPLGCSQGGQVTYGLPTVFYNTHEDLINKPTWDEWRGHMKDFWNARDTCDLRHTAGGVGDSRTHADGDRLTYLTCPSFHSIVNGYDRDDYEVFYGWSGQSGFKDMSLAKVQETYFPTGMVTICDNSIYSCIQKFNSKSVQSIVKQAIDAVLHAEMHYAESVNVFIEDFDHPKTTASDTMYTKQASYEVTDFNFLYSTITANEEWRPALPFNTLEEAKASCSADSSNCLGVTHRHLGGVDLYLRHNGNSHSQLASHDQEHDERLYFQLLDRPFFIRFPIKASTVVNSDLKALCDSYPSCFARGNYVNTHDAEWDSNNYPGDASGNYIAVFYKQFQLQQATKVNAVYTGKTMFAYAGGYGCPAGNYFLQPEGNYYCQSCGRYLNYGSAWGHGSNYCCTTLTSGCSTYYSFISASTIRDGLQFVMDTSALTNGEWAHVNSVDTLYEAFQACNASTSCEGITGYQEITIGAAATQTVLLDQDLLINDGDDFQLIVYDFQTGDCAGSGGTYTVTTYNDKGNFHVLEACHHGGFTENTATFFGKCVLKKTAVATETCSEDCTSLGYKVSQFTDTHCLCTQKVATSGHNIKTDCFPGFELKDGACQPCPAGTKLGTYVISTFDYGTCDGKYYLQPEGNYYCASCGRYLNYGLQWGLGDTYCCTTASSGCPTHYLTIPSDTLLATTKSDCDLCPAETDSVPYSSECFTCPDGKSSVPGGRCTNCQAGQYAVGSGCTNCNAGQYQNEDGAGVCKSCPIGSSSNAGSDALTDCNLCTAAYYLVGNTCTICPGGKTSQALASSCTNCGIGTYGQSGVCSSCQAGKFQNEQGKSSCKLCPQGSYLTTTGADSSDDCTSCTAGKYNGATGSTSNVCTNCPAGTISAARAASCSNCPAGQFQASSGQSSCGSCTGGKYQNLNGQTSCKLCGAGTYHNNNGQTAESACTNCAAGRYSSAGATSCTNCAAGQYSSAAAASCTNCNAGQYSSAAAASCTSCTAGKYSTATGATSDATCQNCNAGKYSTATGATSDTTCQNCAAGRFQGSTGQSSCTTCALGHVSTADGASSCTACPVGTFTRIVINIFGTVLRDTDHTQCSDCGSGFYNDEEGQHYENLLLEKYWCKVCNNGQYQDENRQTGCKDCPTGKWMDYDIDSPSCKNCVAGQYQNEEGKNSCKACPAETWAATAGQSSCSNCQTHQGGTFVGSQVYWDGASGTGLTSGRCCAYLVLYPGHSGATFCENRNEIHGP